jgi:hypothetical protein
MEDRGLHSEDKPKIMPEFPSDAGQEIKNGISKTEMGGLAFEE